MTHDKTLGFVIPLSWMAAIASLAFAGWVRFCDPSLKVPYGYTLVGLWTLGPPIWFMWEWGKVLSESLDSTKSDKKEDIKHWHELARNLWVALVLTLSAIMGLEVVFKG